MAQRQVLRPGRRADGVGLHEAELADRAGKRGRLEQGPGDGIAAQVIGGERHACHDSAVRGRRRPLRRLPHPAAADQRAFRNSSTAALNSEGFCSMAK